MVRQSTPAAQRPEEHIGAVSDVSCPVLAKIGEAFAYAKLAAYRKGLDSIGEGSRIIEGPAPLFAGFALSTSRKDLYETFIFDAFILLLYLYEFNQSPLAHKLHLCPSICRALATKSSL